VTNFVTAEEKIVSREKLGCAAENDQRSRGLASARWRLDLRVVCDWDHWHWHDCCSGLGDIGGLQRLRGLRLVCDLEGKARKAISFYGVIALATVIGLALGYTSLDPIRMLIWNAVLNGIVAVPVMAAMMLLLTRFSTMGPRTSSAAFSWVDWHDADGCYHRVFVLVFNRLKCVIVSKAAGPTRLTSSGYAHPHGIEFHSFTSRRPCVVSDVHFVRKIAPD